MRRFKCHKEVSAEQIVGWQNLVGACFVTIEDASGTRKQIPVPGDFFARYTPAFGDYLVQYEPDGYLSCSPKDKFEAGYTEITPNP